MKIYNKGKRAYIIKAEECISGDGRPEKVDDFDKSRAYINSGTIVEVTEECGQRLVKTYPQELVEWGDPKPKAQEKKTRKK